MRRQSAHDRSGRVANLSLQLQFSTLHLRVSMQIGTSAMLPFRPLPAARLEVWSSAPCGQRVEGFMAVLDATILVHAGEIVQQAFE
jgi:hypothetical protein